MSNFLIYVSTKTLSDSTITLYEAKSLGCEANPISFPVLQIFEIIFWEG
jgi:hypothetical protein